jgi:hypothetical protein
MGGESQGSGRNETNAASSFGKYSIDDNTFNDLTPRWEIARKLIEHENTLQHYRINALLALQGFLFAGFVVMAGHIADPDQKSHIGFFIRVLVIIAIVGMASALVFRDPLLAAMHQVGAAHTWRETQLDVPIGETREAKKYLKGRLFPPIGGRATTGGLISFLENSNPASDPRTDGKSRFFRIFSTIKHGDLEDYATSYPGFDYKYIEDPEKNLRFIW